MPSPPHGLSLPRIGLKDEGQTMDQNAKVGSDPKASEKVVSDDDFGASEQDKMERRYASEETKRNDPGKSIAHSGTGPRDAGVGGNDSGPGSSSGGDMDAGGDALTGVADPHQHPPHQKPGNAGPTQQPVLDPPVVQNQPARSGALDNDSSTSSADVNNETEHDNEGFKGDVTADEASGNSSQ